MKLLCLTGDKYHPESEMRVGIGNALRFYDLTFTEDPAILDNGKLLEYSLLILTKSGMHALPGGEPIGEPWLTHERDTALLDFVRDGCGLIILHSGITRQESSRHRLLAGGYFIHHPKETEMTLIPVGSHPISADIPPFTMNEEQYFCSVSLPNTKPILVSNTEENGSTIAGWTHTFGLGRICALTPGHSKESFTHPQMIKLLRNAAKWCLEKPSEGIDI